MTQDEERAFQELKEKFEAQTAEIKHLKFVASGLKGRNLQLSTMMKQQKEMCEKAILNCRQKTTESVHIYSDKCDRLAERILELEAEKEELKREKKELSDDYFVLKTNQEYYKSLPWYKKIFAK